MRQTQPEIAHRLLAEKFFQHRIERNIRQRVRSAKHPVVALDAGEFCPKSPHAARETFPSKDKRIHPPIRSDRPRDRIVSRRIRILQDNQQVQIRDARDRVAAHSTSV